MKVRKKIGLIFSNNENWIGGTYYYLNLISSFITLDDKDKPEVLVISWKPEDENIVKGTHYPYVSFLNLFIPYSFFEKVLLKLAPGFAQKIIKKRFTPQQIDVVFPAIFDSKFDNINKKVFWIPDFQEFYFADFFKEEEVINRKHWQKLISKSTYDLIFSSESVKNDFQKFYPAHTCKTHVVNFAVTHPSYQNIPINQLKEKYKIKGEYYISPNQFWLHKNHIVILKAVKLLKQKGIHVLVVFTGKEYDHRKPEYTDELKQFVASNDLTDNILFLGFIDRLEQLQLMNHAKAVIQPSLFEGWSTVVEDAKAMNQYVLASDISVHKEQLKQNVTFFNPLSGEDLANKLLAINSTSIQKEQMDYSQNIKRFSEAFLKVIE